MEKQEVIPFLTQEQLTELEKKYKNLTILPPKLATLSLSKIRTTECGLQDFRYHSNRIIRILIEYALTVQNIETVNKPSPMALYNCDQLVNEDKYVAVMIMRAGNSFMPELLNVIPTIQFATILIQRDEGSRTKDPIFYYAKFPKNMENKTLLVCDPMLATGGSVLETIKQAIQAGTKEENITFLNILGCEDGIKRVSEAYPKVKIVCAGVEPILTEIKYLSPGIGDFGDRYFGTTEQ